MLEKTDKRARAALFRARLAEAVARQGLSQAALARAVGADRSTVSQLLHGEDARLPNAQLVAETARALKVSADWLLGLTHRPESAADLMATVIDMPEAPRAMVDEILFRWHREAQGYKVRHVPASLPDMLKTNAVLAWEYETTLAKSAEQAIQAAEERLAWQRGNRSDYEIAMPLHEIASFCRGEGYWSGLPVAARLEQIDWLIALHDQLYPGLRIFLFDARAVFSAPVTIFGPLLAAVYLGRHYLAFRDAERVAAITAHFDGLIRAATLGPRDWPDHLSRLRAEVGQGCASPRQG